jgi:quercetin dioxygenase-like cupin family protein
MKIRALAHGAIAALGLLIMNSAWAASPDSVTPAFSEPIPNTPGKSLIAVVVTYPPGGKTPPHHHAGSAFVTGYVLSGAIRSQVNGGVLVQIA